MVRLADCGKADMIRGQFIQPVALAKNFEEGGRVYSGDEFRLPLSLEPKFVATQVSLQDRCLDLVAKRSKCCPGGTSASGRQVAWQGHAPDLGRFGGALEQQVALRRDKARWGSSIGNAATDVFACKNSIAQYGPPQMPLTRLIQYGYCRPVRIGCPQRGRIRCVSYGKHSMEFDSALDG